DADTGALSFAAAPDFELPGDANSDNDYQVQVSVTDSSGLTDAQDLTVSVTDVAENAAPTITSDGGGDTATVNVAENTTAVTDVETNDDNDSEGSGLTYSLSGGADQALFNIDANTGVLNFNNAPDFEVPGDANGDNNYQVQVTVTDSSGLTDAQDLTVSVTDVVEVSVPDAVDDAFNVTGNVGINVTSTGSIFSNDLGGTPTALFFGATAGTSGDNAANGTNTITTSNGGTVLLNDDGTFTYNPAAGFDGTDSFFYSSSNAGGSDTAEVVFTVADTIWFIDSSANGSTNAGTLANPFTTLAAFNAVNNGTGNNPEASDNIFLHTGSGNYTGGVNLLNNQTLIGQGATGSSLDTLLGITLSPFGGLLPSIGGTDPTIVNSGGSGITLASGNTIRGLNIGSASVDGISGTNVSNIAISEVNISNTGVHGIDLNSVTNFTYEDSVITGAGNGDDEHNINIVNLFGTNLIEDVRMDDISDTGVEIVNSTTDDNITDTLTIRRLDVEDHAFQAFGEDGVFAQATGTANLTLLVDNSQFDINANGSEGVFAISDQTATLNLTIQNSLFDANDAFGSGSFSVVNAGNSNATVALTGNTITDTGGNAIIVNNDDSATSAVTISNNNIGASGGFGMQLRQDGNGTQTVLIDNNTIGASAFGTVFLNARDGNGTLNATVTNNTNLAAPTSGFAPGLALTSENSNTLNASISGNNFTGNNGFPGTEDIALTENNASALNITQTSAANLSAVNNGDAVGVTGTPQFGQSAPPTP
ncbi:MAG: cadherin domain-containing protein, partial [Cyanobacteria bacterium J06642_9]